MKRVAALVGLLLVGWALPAEARPAKQKKPALRGASGPKTVKAPVSVAALEPAQVLYRTQEWAFINRGASDGLKKNQALALSRAGRKIGTCTVDTVNEHSASCRAASAQVGDRFVLERKAVALAKVRPALPSEGELGRRWQTAATAPYVHVEFDGEQDGAAFLRRPYARVWAQHTTFAPTASASGPFQVQQLDAALLELPVWNGLSVSADVSVWVYGRRPVEFRSPLKDSPQLFVRELSVRWQPDQAPLVVRVGRVRLYAVPGLQSVDGAQVGWRGRDGRFEAGGYAGLLPDASTLLPTLSSWAVGAYGFGTFTNGEGTRGLWFQPRARAGWTVRPVVGSRFEVSAALGLWWASRISVLTQLDLSALGNGATESGVGFDNAVADIALHATSDVSLGISGRYRGGTSVEALPEGAVIPLTRSVHASAWTSVVLSSLTSLRVFGGLAKEFAPNLLQAYVGSELAFRTLLGGRLWAALGYQEEPGWLWGRTAYGQLQWRPGHAVSVTARGAWFQRALAGGWENEVGATAGLDVRPWRWLQLRASGFFRLPIAGTASSGARSPALTGTLGLGAEL